MNGFIINSFYLVINLLYEQQRPYNCFTYAGSKALAGDQEEI